MPLTPLRCVRGSDFGSGEPAFSDWDGGPAASDWPATGCPFTVVRFDSPGCTPQPAIATHMRTATQSRIVGSRYGRAIDCRFCEPPSVCTSTKARSLSSESSCTMPFNSLIVSYF